MSLSAGTRLGPYEIQSALGAGGMGEVYRARDTALDREVAIKVLPESFAHDAERLARFQREARTLASLNHPNIAIIHGFEQAGEVHALVMELVEGDDLSQRIARGAIPLDEALPIAKQIAEALEAAHEQGIIHRDLKPANIKVRSDGTVKVLDFGLAKLAAPGSGIGDPGSGRDVGRVPQSGPADLLSQSPTLTTPALMTGVGMILGTAAYMSPEQARGKAVDRRADIWAFGCVLFEMLTGTRAFGGDDVQDTFVAIMRDEPDWARLPATLSPALGTYIRRCLHKNPKQRIPDIAAMRLALEGAFETAGEEGPAKAGHYVRGDGHDVRRGLEMAAAAAGTAVLISGIAWWTLWLPPAPVIRTDVAFSGEAVLSTVGADRDIAITPDGSRLVYVGASGTQLFVRKLDELEATALGAPGVLRGVFISPDSHWVGYFDGPVLEKIAITGGPPVAIATGDLNAARGATWGPDDTILFATLSRDTGLRRVPASGGEVETVTRPDPAKEDHYWPAFLPDGQHVLYTIVTASGSSATNQIALLDLVTGSSRTLISNGSNAHYAASGHLVYVSTGTLHAAPFDLRTHEVGMSVPVISGVVTKGSGAGDYSISSGGILSYVAGEPVAGVGGARPEGEMVSITRGGQVSPLNIPAGRWREPRVSPDGRRMALSDGDNIWLYDLSRGTRIRLTPDGELSARPAWTPDGQRITFRATSQADVDLFSVRADGSGRPEPLLTRPGEQWPDGWSPDNRTLTFGELDAAGGRDILVFSRDGKSSVFLATRFSERSARFSPDGRWIAYTSNESGRDEVYLQPYPGPGMKIAVSVNGGTEPIWAPAGDEIFYREGERLIAAPVRTTPVLEIGRPGILFAGPYAHDGGPNTANYDVFPDGRRFVMIRPVGRETAMPSRLVIVQNWHEELKRLVPVN